MSWFKGRDNNDKPNSNGRLESESVMKNDPPDHCGTGPLEARRALRNSVDLEEDAPDPAESPTHHLPAAPPPQTDASKIPAPPPTETDATARPAPTETHSEETKIKTHTLEDQPPLLDEKMRQDMQNLLAKIEAAKEKRAYSISNEKPGALLDRFLKESLIRLHKSGQSPLQTASRTQNRLEEEEATLPLPEKNEDALPPPAIGTLDPPELGPLPVSETQLAGNLGENLSHNPALLNDSKLPEMEKIRLDSMEEDQSKNLLDIDIPSSSLSSNLSSASKADPYIKDSPSTTPPLWATRDTDFADSIEQEDYDSYSAESPAPVQILTVPKAASVEAPHRLEIDKAIEPPDGLQIHNLGKTYKKRPVLSDISLNVRRGEAVGLLGPNGAGKTTCFYMVCGLISADAGTILLDGQEITELPMYRRARMGIGYLPQEASIFRGLTVEQNIRAVLEATGSSSHGHDAILESLLEEFSISHLRRSPAVALSGGERRRLEIARALATQPHFILLDEPLAGIDPIAVRDIRELVGHLKDRGLGVLITDHNVRETLGIVDRAYILHDGQVLMEGTPDEIVHNAEVRRVYLGDEFN